MYFSRVSRVVGITSDCKFCDELRSQKIMNCSLHIMYIMRFSPFLLIHILQVIRILIFGCFLTPDYHHEVYKISDFSSDVNGEAKETQPIFLGRFLCQLISQQNSVAICN